MSHAFQVVFGKAGLGQGAGVLSGAEFEKLSFEKELVLLPFRASGARDASRHHRPSYVFV